MLDLIGILFSTAMLLLVIVRAVQLDRRQPWFEPVKREQRDGAWRPWQPKR